MQIAGQICNVCGKKVVFAGEGKSCRRCDRVVHLVCEGTACAVCGAALEGYIRADGFQNATVPRALRPGKTGAAGFAILFIFLLVLLAVYAMTLT